MGIRAAQREIEQKRIQKVERKKAHDEWQKLIQEQKEKRQKLREERKERREEEKLRKYASKYFDYYGYNERLHKKTRRLNGFEKKRDVTKYRLRQQRKRKSCRYHRHNAQYYLDLHAIPVEVLEYPLKGF